MFHTRDGLLGIAIPDCVLLVSHGLMKSYKMSATTHLGITRTGWFCGSLACCLCGGTFFTLFTIFFVNGMRHAVVPVTLLEVMNCSTQASGRFQIDEAGPWPRIVDVTYPGTLCADETVWPPSYDCCERFSNADNRFWARLYDNRVTQIHLDGYAQALHNLLESRVPAMFFMVVGSLCLLASAVILVCLGLAACRSRMNRE